MNKKLPYSKEEITKLDPYLLCHAIIGTVGIIKLYEILNNYKDHEKWVILNEESERIQSEYETLWNKEERYQINKMHSKFMEKIEKRKDKEIKKGW